MEDLVAAELNGSKAVCLISRTNEADLSGKKNITTGNDELGISITRRNFTQPWYGLAPKVFALFPLPYSDPSDCDHTLWT